MFNHKTKQACLAIKPERLHFHFSLSCIGEGNGSPPQCSCLENPRDGGAWWAGVYGVAQSRTRLKRLSSSCSRIAGSYGSFGEGNGNLSFLWHSAAAKSLQSCLTLCNPIEGSPPGSPVPGIIINILTYIDFHFLIQNYLI